MNKYLPDPITGFYPHDVIRNVDENGDLILIGHKYIDPFDPDKCTVCMDPTYFDRNYGLTKAQVWNLCHGYDKDYTPKCHCGELLKFVNFKIGYQQYCSGSCRAKIQSKEHWEDQEYRDKILPYLHSPETIALRNRTEFFTKNRSR